MTRRETLLAQLAWAGRSPERLAAIRRALPLVVALLDLGGPPADEEIDGLLAELAAARADLAVRSHALLRSSRANRAAAGQAPDVPPSWFAASGGPALPPEQSVDPLGVNGTEASPPSP